MAALIASRAAICGSLFLHAAWRCAGWRRTAPTAHLCTLDLARAHHGESLRLPLLQLGHCTADAAYSSAAHSSATSRTQGGWVACKRDSKALLALFSAMTSAAAAAFFLSLLLAPLPSRLSACLNSSRWNYFQRPLSHRCTRAPALEHFTSRREHAFSHAERPASGANGSD